MLFRVLLPVLFAAPPWMAGFAQEVAQEGQEKAALAVSVVRAQVRDVEEAFAAEGEVKPRETAAVNAQVAGVPLARIHANVGDWVKKGQVLAEFDAALLRHDAAKEEAALLRAQAALKLAAADAARAQKLAKDNAVSRADAQRSSAAKEQAQAAVAGAVAARDAARLRLEYAVVRAPVDGVVASRAAELGMTANVGLPLFTLLADGALEWHAQVAPENVARLSAGTPVRVRAGGKTADGRVVRFAPVADARSRLVTVFAALGQDAALRAGMLVRGEFLLGRRRVPVIPASALVREDGYDFVVLVGADGRAKRQALVLGARLDDWVAVEAGLPADADIVARGGSFLQDGDLVRVVGDK